MALCGELEDLPFVDIVQVIALGRRSGELRIVAAPRQEAVVGFRDGQIVSARSWMAAPLASQTLPAGADEREILLRRRIRDALRLLLGLSEGRFEFHTVEEAATSAGDLHFEELREGLDTQGAILDLLRQGDEDGRSHATPKQAAPTPARVDLGDERMMAEFKHRLEAILIADPASRYSVGIAFKEMGLLDDAIAAFERATHDPRHAFEGASMLGLCCLEKGDAKEAARWLEKGLALPGRSEHEYQGLRVLLALAYAASGRMKEALERYQLFARRGLWLGEVADSVRAISTLDRAGQVLPFPRTATRK